MFVNWQTASPAFNFSKAYGGKIPDIDTNIDRVLAPTPIVVNVAEELKCTPTCMIPSDHRIVTQSIVLLEGAVAHFRKIVDRIPRQLQRQWPIVVADNEML